MAAAAVQARRLLLACLAFEDKLAAGGNRRAQPARTPGRCANEIGAIFLSTDVQGHPEW